MERQYNTPVVKEFDRRLYWLNIEQQAQIALTVAQKRVGVIALPGQLSLEIS